MSGIGLMVGLLLAGLIGWYFLSRRTGGNLTGGTPSNPTIVTTNDPLPATAPPNTIINGVHYGPDGKPLTTDSKGVTYNGTTFITEQSSAGKLAAESGASAYDPNNPAVAARTVNAISVATNRGAYDQANTDAYNATNGTNLTVDEWVALMAKFKTQQIQTSEFAASQQLASQAGTTFDPGPSPGPGFYWSYVYNAWTPLPANTTTGPTTETRSGRGHF